MNQDNNEILNHHRMEELLPDYVFERIDDDNREAFERSLGHYPDIQKEIREVRRVFSKVEQMDIDGMFKKRSRNMSVKVRQKLDDKKRKAARGNVLFRFVIPTAALVLLVFMAINTIRQYTRETKTEIAEVAEPMEIIKPGETLALIDSSVDYDQIADETGIVEPQFDASLLQAGGDLSESDLTGLELAIEEYISSISLEAADSEAFFHSFTYDELNTLSEDEFQKIIEELENADFSS
jgi:hypothetical protein